VAHTLNSPEERRNHLFRSHVLKHFLLLLGGQRCIRILLACERCSVVETSLHRSGHLDIVQHVVICLSVLEFLCILNQLLSHLGVVLYSEVLQILIEIVAVFGGAKGHRKSALGVGFDGKRLGVDTKNGQLLVRVHRLDTLSRPEYSQFAVQAVIYLDFLWRAFCHRLLEVEIEQVLCELN
jgi:hypothetical protein